MYRFVYNKLVHASTILDNVHSRPLPALAQAHSQVTILVCLYAMRFCEYQKAGILGLRSLCFFKGRKQIGCVTQLWSSGTAHLLPYLVHIIWVGRFLTS
jgi:hypothetical protein